LTILGEAVHALLSPVSPPGCYPAMHFNLQCSLGVKNPISLAKKILDTSTQPLSLRRVPPNLLVGSGATQFAKENGIETVPNPSLVSKNAEDRYLRWREDLKRAEARERARKAKAAAVSSSIRRTPSPTPYDKAAHPSNAPEMRDHSTAIFTGTWNEGQPDSPDRSGSPSGGHDPSRTTDSAMSYDEGEASSFEGGDDTDPGGPMKRRRIDTEEEPPATDMITDTVGAIAIDLQGHIAAGSSSGGIGMKHRGRAGPAALVGVGTAVVPTDPSDEEGISTAAVTSGTGEHMATTMASAKCAERLYHGTRRGPGGRDVPEPDEHAVLDSFVVNDFMNHPGVRGQPSSAAAIGVMAVKKDRHAAYFYFAHNTDSFALASMASTEREPLCVMSRLGKQGGVAQGGRRVKLG
jgi:taspase (threonine aspartase 1)